MTKFAIPAAIAALIALAPAASMARTVQTFDGTVQSINSSAGSVTLTDGTSYLLGTAALQAQLKPGAHVNLTVKDINGSDTVTGFTTAM